VDSDCVAVFSGDYCAQKCGDCDCDNSAIARAALDDYEDARAAMRCAPELGCGVCDCAAALPVCVQSQCSTLDREGENDE